MLSTAKVVKSFGTAKVLVCFFAVFVKKAHNFDIRAEEVRHFLRRVSRLVSSHERTLAEA